MRAAVLLLATWGCYNPTVPAGVPCGDNDACPAGQECIAGICAGTLPELDASTIDAFVIDAPALCATWQARHFDPCTLPAPMGDLVLTDALSGFSWDTDKPELKGKMNTVIPVTTMVMTQTVGPDVLVASVNNFTLEDGANLDLNGSRPLLIAAWGTVTIAGDIDAAASFSIPGPGGSSATSTSYGCPSAPTGDAGSSGIPSRGGGGGAMQGNGGRGGNTGGLGGTSITPPASIQGGCAAGSGGASSGGTTGTRGAGGGALQITARETITVTTGALIHAGGGGGSYGRVAYGAGGGGGAGGYIGLDAPTVNIAGTLAANGGSGGGGASDVAAGSSGANGRPDGNAATGGAGATTSNIGTCARGGNGSSGGTLAGAGGGSSPCGGGGGGGGAGYILIWSPMLNVTGTVSPPVTGGP